MASRAIALLVAVVAGVATTATASPAACADPCTINATGIGFVTPVLVVGSGSTVAWTTSDEAESHNTADGIQPGERCFSVPVGYFEPIVPVEFTIRPDGLYAHHVGDPVEDTARCESAEAMASGHYVLPYHCIIHSWMRGALIVEPEGL